MCVHIIRVNMLNIHLPTYNHSCASYNLLVLNTKELLSLLENKTVYIDRVGNVQYIVLSNVRHQSDEQMKVDWKSG